MIEINTLEISGMASVLQALRLPFGKECRSEVNSHHSWEDESDKGLWINYNAQCSINDKDLTLLSTLVKRGDAHSKVIRGLLVYAEIEAPVYWWSEMETYRAGHERLSSQSTMHIDARGLKGDELVELKRNIPMGKVLKKVDFFSYQCLRNIVKQRTNHRLPEWATFIDWVKSLPFAKELILTGLEYE
jgi:hypothetical protein